MVKNQKTVTKIKKNVKKPTLKKVIRTSTHKSKKLPIKIKARNNKLSNKKLKLMALLIIVITIIGTGSGLTVILKSQGASDKVLGVSTYSIAACYRNYRADINNDDKINVIDARMILKEAAGSSNPALTSIQKSNADIDNNGKITTIDALKALRTAAELDCVGEDVDTTNITKNCLVDTEYSKTFTLSFYNSLYDSYDAVYNQNTAISLGFPAKLSDTKPVYFRSFSQIAANNFYEAGKAIRLLGAYNGETFYVLDTGGDDDLDRDDFLDIYMPRLSGESDSAWNARLEALGLQTVAGCVPKVMN